MTLINLLYRDQFFPLDAFALAFEAPYHDPGRRAHLSGVRHDRHPIN